MLCLSSQFGFNLPHLCLQLADRTDRPIGTQHLSQPLATTLLTEALALTGLQRADLDRWLAREWIVIEFASYSAE